MPKRKKDETSTVNVIPLVRSRKKAQRPQQSPVEQALRMTDVEALRLGKLDAEVLRLRGQIANIEQSVVISEMKIAEQLKQIQQQLDEYKVQKAAEKSQIIGAFNAKHKEYKDEVLAVCTKYGLDPEKFTYDPDTGVLRDLRNPPTEGSPPPA